MLKIPSRAYTRLSTILRLPGSEGLRGLQEEVVPTQDLNRVLQADRVKIASYSLLLSPAASASTDVQWNDLSDWEAVDIDGVPADTDASLPQDLEDRIIVACSLQTNGSADYTTAEVKRFVTTGTGPLGLLTAFGAVPTAHSNAVPDPPMLLPQWLIPGEFSVRFTQIVSGAGATFHFSVQMISAERGVLAPYVGV